MMQVNEFQQLEIQLILCLHITVFHLLSTSLQERYFGVGYTRHLWDIWHRSAEAFGPI